MPEDARARESERAGRDGLIDGVDHDLEFGRARMGVAVDRALTHCVEAHGTVADHAADIDTLGHGVDGVVVLAIGLPVPFEAGHDRGRWNVLDRLHELGEQFVIGGLDWREGNPAIADHNRCDAVPARRAAYRVPGHLGVQVAMDVYKSGRDQAACGIDRAGGGAIELADLDDALATDPDVGLTPRCPGAVDDSTVLDDNVEAAHDTVAFVVADLKLSLAHCLRRIPRTFETLRCG